MSTWSFVLSAGGNITSLIDTSSIYKTRRLHSELKPNVNKVEFRAEFSAALWAALLSTEDITCTITKDGITYFYGYVSPNFSTDILDGRKYISFIVEDPTLKLLGKTIASSITHVGAKVCDPTDTAHSLVHLLCAAAGVALAAGLPTIATVVPYLCVLPDDKATYAGILGDLLYCYSCVYSFADAGSLYLYETINGGAVATTATLNIIANGGSIRRSLRPKKIPRKYDDIRVRFDSVEFRSGLVLFRDSSGATGSQDCVITLNASGDADGNDYYPTDSGTTEVFSEWNNPDGLTIVAATSAYLDTTVGGGISLSRALTNFFRRASFAYHNTSGYAQNITRLRINGDAWVKIAENVARSSNAGQLLLEYKAKYLFTLAAAQALVLRLSQYYAYSSQIYNTRSKLDIAIGTYVLVSDSVYSGRAQACRVISRKYCEYEKTNEYDLEAVADYVAIAIKLEGSSTSGQGAGAAAAQAAAVAANLRTFSTVALVLAATGQRDGEIVYCLANCHLYKWSSSTTSWTDTSATLPLNPIFQSTFDDTPDIPDNAAGVTYQTLKDWTGGLDSWTSAYGSLAIVGGRLVLTGTGTVALQVVRPITAGAGRDCRAIVNSSKAGSITIHTLQAGVYTLLKTITVEANKDAIIDGISVGAMTQVYITKSSGVAIGDTLSLAVCYIGTGDYTFPALDNSGNGVHQTIHGSCPVPGVSGKALSRNGNNYEVTQNPITLPDVFLYRELWNIPQTANIQCIFGIGVFGGARLLITRAANSAYMNIYYWTGTTDGVVQIPGFFPATGFVDGKVKINFLTSYYYVYKDGTLFASGPLTTVVKPASGLAYFGRTADGSLYCSGIVDERLGYDAANITASDILGLSLNKTIPPKYTKERYDADQLIDSGWITPALKRSYVLPMWDALNGNGSSTGTYWTARLNGLAVSPGSTGLTALITAAKNAYDAILAYLYTTPGVLVGTTWLSNIPVVAATWKSLWDTYYTAEAALVAGTNSQIAANAQTNAITAAAADATAKANAVNATLTALANSLNNDDNITPVEKSATNPTYAALIVEQSGLDAQATAYSITTEKTAYDNAIAAIVAFVDLWNIYDDMGTTTTMTAGKGAEFRTLLTSTLTTKQTLLQKISSQASQATAPRYRGIGRLVALMTAAFAGYSVTEAGVISATTTITPNSGDYMVNYYNAGVATLKILIWGGASIGWTEDGKTSQHLMSAADDLIALAIGGVVLAEGTTIVTLFAKQIFAQSITMDATGILKSSNFSAGVSGYRLTSLDGVLEAMSALLTNCRISGALEISLGILSAGNNIVKRITDIASGIGSSGSYAKVVISAGKYMSLTATASGVVRISFDLRSMYSDRYAKGKIYKNGVAVGTERTTYSTTFVTYTEDISVSAGDVIALYAAYDPLGNNAYATNFSIGIAGVPGIMTFLGNDYI